MPIFLPSLNDPPVPYAECRTLNAPQPPFTFAGVAYRIMMFSRESLVDLGARLLWSDFQDPSGGGDTSPRRAWTRSWAAPVVTMAFIYGKPAGTGGAIATIHEFLNLAWELFQLPEMHRADTVAGKLERDAILARLSTSRLASVDADDAVRTAGAIWNLSHATGQLVADTDADFVTLARDWSIYERLRGRYGGEANSKFVELEHQLFLTSPRLFVRACCGLLGYALEERPAEDTPGVFFLPKERAWEGHLQDVGLDDYGAVLRRLTVAASELRSRGEELLLYGDPDRRRALFELVRRRPIILLDDYPKEDDAALILGPARFLKAVSRFLLIDTVEHFGDRFGGDDAAKRRGLAFERYLEDALAGTPVRRLAPDRGKTPDFEWVGGQYHVLIEAKVKPLPSEMVTSPQSLVAAWDNLLAAVEQGSAYASRLAGQPPKKWVLIIVVNDGYADEQTSFRHITASWGLLKDTDLTALAVLPPGAVEHLVSSSTADEVGEMIERLWLDAGQRSPLDQPATVDPYRTKHVPSILNEAYRELFGCGFNEPHEHESEA
jgi:hypothetical protein